MALKEILEHEDKRYALIGENGNPIYEVEGKDIEYDGESLAANVRELNAERAKEKTELEDSQTQLETMKANLEKYNGIDLEEAKKALNTVQNLDQTKLIEANEVDKIKASAIEATKESYETQMAELRKRYEPIEAERDTYKAQLEREIISNAFSRSKFIEDKISVPWKMVEAQFSNHVTVKNGKLKILDSQGKEIYSRAKPSQPADFDEAMELIVESYPYKNKILKATSGPTSLNGQPADLLGDKLITRAEADRMAVQNPANFAKLMGDGYRVVDPSPV